MLNEDTEKKYDCGRGPGWGAIKGRIIRNHKDAKNNSLGQTWIMAENRRGSYNVWIITGEMERRVNGNSSSTSGNLF